MAKYNTLTPDAKLKMDDYMKNQKKPAGRKAPTDQVSFDETKTVDYGQGSKTVTIHYDENGFPDFTSYCPEPRTDFVYRPDPNSNNLKALEGTSTDLNRATAVMEKKFANNPNINFKVDGTGFTLTDGNGTVRYTWHHHQDGKTMFPVPSKIHTGTFTHSGGATILENSKDLIGFFAPPNIN